ncbi:hypothetical protein HDU93_002033 [Gonapodya sp. JEL0774]|nr:hypothetical protein HDU93_002033 [Gonapodya sp. JEL0774]
MITSFVYYRHLATSVRTSTSLPILLLQPPGACSSFTRSGSLYPPLGLYQLAATVAATECEVLDADGWKFSVEETLQRVQEKRPRAVGFTVTSKTCSLVEEWASEIKKVAEGLPPVVIAGGPHAGFSPQEVFKKCPSVDVVVRGEGEPVFPGIVEVLSSAPPPNILDLLAEFDGVLVRDKPRENDRKILRVEHEHFSTLAFPRLDLTAPIKNYWAPDSRRTPMVTFMTQRGCPFKCGFCSSPNLHGNQVRGFPVERVIDELERLSKDHGVQEVSFVDDVFTVKPSRLLALCQGISARKLHLSWYCNARADQVSTRLAEAMAASGAHQVFLGFESGCDDMLKRISKGATVAQLERGAQILKDAGIDRSVGFVIGLPGETDDSVTKTIELFHRVKPERRQFTRWTPLAGSPLVMAGHGVVGADARTGFHDQRQDDKVGQWIQRCYDECPGNPSV